MSLATSELHLLRDLAPRVLGAVARRHGNFAAAEDAVQEALWAATEQWPKQGVPNNPCAWLVQVANRRMQDQVRAEVSRRRREASTAKEQLDEWQAVPALDDGAEPEGDDTLLLLMMCCHPALSAGSAVALTLRAVGGLTTQQIAGAYLVPEATIAQRISRAKQTIKHSGVRFQLPSAEERRARLSSVLHVLYLIFNEGYVASEGPLLQRVDLSTEAIRLTRGLYALLPGEPEVTGLLALMLLTDARRAARSRDGELVSLDEQDRSRWDRRQINEGLELIGLAFSRGAVGVYQLQAAIAALHDEALTAERTDWPQILALYGLLEKMTQNPMVRLNRAVAVAMVHGPERGLQLLAALDRDARIAGHYRLAAVRAHLHERAGDNERAIAAYQQAAAATASTPERNYLLLKAARLAGNEQN